MLVDNKEPRARSIGNIYLIPGINNIDDKRWERAMEKGFKKAVNGMINDGLLEISDAKQKLTQEIVRKTYDVNLLEEWAADPKHKGPLRGAIRKQIKSLELDGLSGE